LAATVAADWPKGRSLDPPERVERRGGGHYLVYALRIDLDSLEADVRSDIDDYVYEELGLDVMLEELKFLADFDRTAAVPLGGSHYVFWMTPTTDPLTTAPGL
jgi:hypothetical protein